MNTRSLLRLLATLALAVAVALGWWLLRPADPPPPPAAAPDTLAATPAAAPAEVIVIFFSRDEESVPVRRPVPAGEAGPEAALRELLAGPTQAERDAGINSWFSPETAGLLHGFSLDDDGVAHVNFGDLAAVIPSASSSAGSELLLRELNVTLFSFPQVSAIEYTVNGSCEAFWNWLQYDCEVVQRPGEGYRQDREQ